MFGNTRKARTLLGAAASSTLGLGVAVVVGVIPQWGSTIPSLQAAAVAPIDVAVPVVTDQAPTVEISPSTLPPPPPPTTEIPTGIAPPPEVTTTVPPPTTSVPHPEPEVSAPESVLPEADDSTEPPPSTVPRRVPSSTEVDQALEGLRPYVRSIFSPGPAQVAEAGDKICTAMDEGQTIDEVKAAGLELVKKVPFTTVRAGAGDYVVRTAVTLYCPGHASKLG